MSAAGKREKSEVRRAQIVTAAVDLLGECHLEALTTRRIAKALGLSQPALFRHFRSREALLEAVLEHARGELGAIGARALAEADGSEACLRALVDGLFRHVQRHPGLPRLLFGHVSDGNPSLRLGLRRLLTLQVNLVAAVIADGQRDGALRPDLDPAEGATALVGMLQGTILQWEVHGRQADLPSAGPGLVSLWLSGAGATRASPGAERAEAPTAPEGEGGPGLRALDVRPALDAGEDPLQIILAALARLSPPGVLELTVPFVPKPLLALMKRRGHETRSRAFEGLCLVEVMAGDADVRDLTDLEAPEPMVRVLAAAEGLAPGGVFVARLPRMPHPMLAELKARNFTFEALESPDGTALVRVVGPA